MRINRIPNERLAFETAKAISAILEKEQGKEILLMLAGGSSFGVYDAISPQWLSDNMTLAMTDDRFSHEMDINNSHLLQATDFYNESVNADAYFISSEIWGEETPEQLAQRFENGLKKWREEFPDGVVIAVFGMGEDGHICGMIPPKSDEGAEGDKIAGRTEGQQKTFAELFEDPEKLVRGYWTPNNEHHERISITMPFIRKNVDHAVAYISGEKKRSAFERLTAEDGTLEGTPARILRELKNAEVYTDIAEK